MMQVEYRRAHQARLQELLNAGGGSRSRAFAAQVEQVLIEGNRIDRLRGVDRTGEPLEPWKHRVGQYEDAPGPTLAPFGESSRSITSHYTDVRHTSNGWTLSAGFRGPGVEILAYHAAGKAGCGVPIERDGKIIGFRGIKGCTTGIMRDIFGVSPATRRDIITLFREHAKNTFRARVGRAATETYRRAAAFFGNFFG